MTRRQSIAAGIAEAAIQAFVPVLVLLLLSAGCGPSDRTSTASLEPPIERKLSAHGTVVEFKAWLSDWPALEQGALAEVDSTVATQLPGDPPWPPGVPSGWRVEVEEPKLPILWGSQWILVTGWTDLKGKVIHAGWRLDQNDKLYLPALAWECRTARTGSEPRSALPPWLTGGAK